MYRWLPSKKLASAIVVLLGAVPGCSKPDDSHPFEPGVFAAENLKACSEIATTFLAEELAWTPDQYRLEYDRIEDELTLFRATHRSDIEAIGAGRIDSGQSRQIRVRCASGEVAQVLRYQ